MRGKKPYQILWLVCTLALAGLATGVWKDLDEIRSQWTLDKIYTPAMDAEERDRLYAGWCKAVSRARDWAD